MQPFHSPLDEQHAVPGTTRPALAHALAVEAGTLAEPTFDTQAWRDVTALDAADGFGTRLAARGVLRRPSDGRFVIFRYPFRDGTRRFVLPGGGADPGEDPVAALSREVFEETGTEAFDLRSTGLVLYHLLASTVGIEGLAPTIQYSPILVGSIADELPHTDGRDAHWFSIDEFAAQPRRPISDPLLDLLRTHERGEHIDPVAVWLPA